MADQTRTKCGRNDEQQGKSDMAFLISPSKESLYGQCFGPNSIVEPDLVLFFYGVPLSGIYFSDCLQYRRRTL